MADKKLEDAVEDRMYVTPKVREKELLRKKDNFVSTGMDDAAFKSDLEEVNSEFKRGVRGVESKLREKWKYAKGGAVPDFAKGGSSLPRTKYKWGK